MSVVLIKRSKSFLINFPEEKEGKTCVGNKVKDIHQSVSQSATEIYKFDQLLSVHRSLKRPNNNYA